MSQLTDRKNYKSVPIQTLEEENVRLQHENQQLRDFIQNNQILGIPNNNHQGLKKWSAKSLILKTVITIVVTLFIFSILGLILIRSSNSPFFIMGYAPIGILTSSMQDTIPKGSLIFVKHVDPESLVVGDDITFFIGPNTTFTHRIIAIYPNYNGTGTIVFQTKGTNNLMPDDFMVYAENVVGRVVSHVPKLGALMNFILG